MRSCLSFALVLALAVHCQGQVVQLPAVGNFSVSTTVSVPDQGTTSLGGGGASSYGAASRGAGPLASRAQGGISSANSASISATIIDLAAMDEAILNMPANSSNVPNYETPKQGKKIFNTLVPHHYDREIKRHPAQPHPYDWMVALGPQGNDHFDSAENRVLDGSNVRYFLEKAADAHAQGHAAAARVYYQMAMERLTPAQRKRFDEIKASRTADAKAKTKKGKEQAKTTSAAKAPAASASEPAAPSADDKTDMNSSPF